VQEEQLYNIYLKISRSINNKPYKVRKNFDKFSETEDFVYLNKLVRFFNQHNHIIIEDFFAAPFLIYPDEEYFDLKFYTTQRAIKTYSMFHDKYLLETPDSEHTQQKVKESILFIYNFCKERKVPVQEYLNISTGSVPDFIIHLKDRKICLYILFIFENIYSIIKELDKEIINSVYPLILKINFFRTKLYNSKKCSKNIFYIKQSVENKKI
jgi:hypothetical protein